MYLRGKMNIDDKIRDLQGSQSNRMEVLWQPLMEKYDCQYICEVGVREGNNFKKMIRHRPKLAVAVDCWKDTGEAPTNDGSFTQEELDNQYETFKNGIGSEPFVKVCRGFSQDVVKEFPDEYFDLVYIDADHTHEGVWSDLVDWYPKVKKGGILSGHDYRRRKFRTKDGWIKFGVVSAVNKFIEENNIKTFFLLTPTSWGIVKI